jgi:hypothetical protein
MVELAIWIVQHPQWRAGLGDWAKWDWRALEGSALLGRRICRDGRHWVRPTILRRRCRPVAFFVQTNTLSLYPMDHMSVDYVKVTCLGIHLPMSLRSSQ